MELYTETKAPENVRRRVEAITAQKHSSLRTRAFQQIPDSEEPSDTWLEAQLDTETGFWKVVQYETKNVIILDNVDIGQSLGVVKSSNTIYPQICFFDALYLCAEFEKGFLNSELPASSEFTDNHFRSVGEDEGQVFGVQSRMPAPVADGIILVDCPDLPLNDAEITARSRGNLEFKDVKPVFSQASQNLPVLKKPQNFEMTLAQNWNRQARIDAVDKNKKNATSNIKSLQTDLYDSANHNFALITRNQKNFLKTRLKVSGAATGTFLFWFTLLPGYAVQTFSTSDFIPADFGTIVTLIGGTLTTIFGLNVLNNEAKPNITNRAKGTRHKTETQLQKLDKFISQQTDPDFKKYGEDIAREVAIGYRMLCARATYRESMKHRNMLWRHRVNRDLRKLEKEALKRGVDQEQRESYRASVIHNIDDYRIDQKWQNDVEELLREFRSQCETYFDQHIEQAKSLPAPTAR